MIDIRATKERRNHTIPFLVLTLTDTENALMQPFLLTQYIQAACGSIFSASFTSSLKWAVNCQGIGPDRSQYSTCNLTFFYFLFSFLS
jgi:hypothetical protein